MIPVEKNWSLNREGSKISFQSLNDNNKAEYTQKIIIPREPSS